MHYFVISVFFCEILWLIKSHNIRVIRHFPFAQDFSKSLIVSFVITIPFYRYYLYNATEILTDVSFLSNFPLLKWWI